MKPFDCSYKYLVVGSERACKTLDHEEFDVANPRARTGTSPIGASSSTTPGVDEGSLKPRFRLTSRLSQQVFIFIWVTVQHNIIADCEPSQNLSLSFLYKSRAF